MTSKPAPRKTADTISRMERESSTVMAFLLMTVLAFPDVIDVAVMISMMPVHDSSHASVPEGLARTDVDAEGLRIGMAPALFAAVPAPSCRGSFACSARASAGAVEGPFRSLAKK